MGRSYSKKRMKSSKIINRELEKICPEGIWSDKLDAGKIIELPLAVFEIRQIQRDLGDRKDLSERLKGTDFPATQPTQEMRDDIIGGSLKFPKPTKKIKKKTYSSIKPKGLTLDSALDEAFSLLVKCKAGWKCEFTNCGQKFNVHPDVSVFNENRYGDYSFLDCSHFFRRSDAGTSHEPDNAHAFCRTCHERLEKLKNFGEEYYEFTFKRLGEVRFKELLSMANSIVKTGKDAKIILLRSMIEDIGELGYKTNVLNFKFRKIFNG